MNGFIVISCIIVVSVAVAACAARPKATARPPLPSSCSLPTLTAAERERHEKRCDLIRQTAFATSTTREGFRFRIDLKKMPLAALQEWASNEQSCCAFLRITVRTLEEQRVAEVSVVCPPELRKETMRVFGLTPS